MSSTHVITHGYLHIQQHLDSSDIRSMVLRFKLDPCTALKAMVGPFEANMFKVRPASFRPAKFYPSLSFRIDEIVNNK